MLAVFKYPLTITDEQKVSMREGAQPLSVQDQHGVLTLWALVDLEAPPRDVSVRIVGTGNPINGVSLRGFTFVGTVQESTRPLVWHVFVGPTAMRGV